MTKRKLELDGIRDGCPVKLIFKDDGYRKQWFEKPKGFNVNTLHFEEEAGVLRVHVDSADNQQFREMFPSYSIASGSFVAGRTFCESNGMDLAVLPMQPHANGYRIDDTLTGSIVRMPDDGYCLMAFGEWSAWQDKPKPRRVLDKDRSRTRKMGN